MDMLAGSGVFSVIKYFPVCPILELSWISGVPEPAVLACLYSQCQSFEKIGAAWTLWIQMQLSGFKPRSNSDGNEKVHVLFLFRARI